MTDRMLFRRRLLTAQGAGNRDEFLALGHLHRSALRPQTREHCVRGAERYSGGQQMPFCSRLSRCNYELTAAVTTCIGSASRQAWMEEELGLSFLSYSE